MNRPSSLPARASHLRPQPGVRPRRSIRMIGAAAAVCLIASVLMAAEPLTLDPDQAYTAVQTNPVEYDATIELVFTPPAGTQAARVWLPVPQSDSAQTVRDYSCRPAPASDRREPLFGNRFVCLDFAKPTGGRAISQHFRLQTHELHWNLDPARVVRVAKYPAGFDRYLRNEDKIVVDERARTLARSIVGAEANPAIQLRKVMVWVIDHLDYSHEACSLQASSVWALEHRAGHCSDYHGLTAALMRSLGVPSRVTSGIIPDETRASPSHCKNETYLAPYGWVSFDVSEADRQISQAAADPKRSAGQKAAVRKRVLDRLFSGYRENAWYLVTQGTDYDLAPAAASGRPPLVRTAFIEVDGKPLPDPDPGNPQKREFAWMTVVHFTRIAGQAAAR